MTSFLVLLDRDGTVIADKHYLADPAGVELLPGVVDGLRALAQAGAVFFIISNQSGIGRGFFKAEDAEAVNERMHRLLREEGVTLTGNLYCPHAPAAKCACRKPGIALIERAAEETGLPLSEAFMIGDKESDVAAGKNVGCTTVLLKPRDANLSGRATDADFVATDFQDAAAFVLRRRTTNS